MNRLPALVCLLACLSFQSRAQLNFITQPTPTAEPLFGISFADTLTGYACGDHGTILKTTNGGASWTGLTVPTPAVHFWDIRVVPQSAGQKVVAAGDNSTILKSVNGGTTWTVQTVPFGAGSFVFGLQCLDSLNYYACGGDFATLSGAVLKTTNGGATWTIASATPGNFFLEKVWMFNSSSGYVAGTGASPTSGAMLKTSNGTSYTSVKSMTNICTNLWCHSATNIVAVGIGGEIWKSTDGGATWQDRHLNSTDLYGLAFRDAQRGYACGGVTAGGIVLSTANGGDTWVQEAYTGAENLFSNCVTGNLVFFAGEGGKILKARIPSANSVQELQTNAGVMVSAMASPGTLIIHRSTAAEEQQFRLMDAGGGVVLQATLPASQLKTTIDQALPSGVYYFSLWSLSGQAVIATGKVAVP